MKLDFEKIKMFLIEKKKYLLIIVAGIAIFFFMKNSNSNKEANQLGNNNISQNSSSFSSSTSSSMQTSNTTQSESKDNAQVKAINRAVMLKDQDKIHIPYKGEKVENATTVTSNGESTPSTSGTSSSQTGDKVNINTASAADLQKLNGIGEKKAEQIIAYRDQNGQFKKIEDLMQVSGIGEKTFAALKDQLAI